MKHGFIKTGTASVDIAVAAPKINAQSIINAVVTAEKNGIKLLALPELCITGCTCADLFSFESLIFAAESALFKIAQATSALDVAFAVGLPIKHGSKLYNAAAVCHRGKILGIVPKMSIASDESRRFASGAVIGNTTHTFSNGIAVPFGTGFVFAADNLPCFTFGVEIGSDALMSVSPAVNLCKKGANIILNPAASCEIISRESFRRNMICANSARLYCAYVYADAAPSESTTDMVFSGHCMIYENGALLAENKPFAANYPLIADIDAGKIDALRMKNSLYGEGALKEFAPISFSPIVCETKLTRKFAKNPFVPEDAETLRERCELILNLQTHGLKKRITHTDAKKAVLGISGGLDSTLALLVMVSTADMLGHSRKDVVAVTMPCFGTTVRTKSNAQKLCELLDVDFKEVNITAAVKQHFADIALEDGRYDATFENAQARERTQVLMDIAGMEGGFVVGTGDLSELALGWCTYNGDHMSMYGVNASVPKSLVRAVVTNEAVKYETAGEAELAAVLFDILDTPVSPELLPPKDGEIQQKTEMILGPYDVHDFFLYYTVRFGFTAEKIYRMALSAYDGVHSAADIKQWMVLFYKRFFSQQFKRSCSPDGVKTGSVTLSPRGDWLMPSDAIADSFLDGI